MPYELSVGAAGTVRRVTNYLDVDFAFARVGDFSRPTARLPFGRRFYEEGIDPVDRVNSRMAVQPTAVDDRDRNCPAIGRCSARTPAWRLAHRRVFDAGGTLV